MDMQMIQKAMDWVQDSVGDRITKQELVQKVMNSGLPDEAQSAFSDLPEGELTKGSIVTALKDKLMAGVGGRGGFGGIFGKRM